MIQLPAKIDIGQLKSILLQRKIMKPRFMLPISAEQAYDCLLAATMAELEYRHRSFYENDDAKAQLRQMARWLTSGSSKFGMLMCGECGNGKSTLLKAFQQLLNILAIPIPDGHGNYGIQITDAKYVAHLARTDNSAFLQLSQKDMLGIYDPGTESQEVMDFGNVVTPVIDLLTKRYEDQLFMLIPISMDGHKQFLSCMRDLDLNLGASTQSALSGDIRISDEVLLSGILDVTDRNIFWKDDKRRFLGANQNFLDYYGFAGIEEVMGKTDEDLGWAQRNKLFADDERRVLRGDSIRGVLGVTMRADGAWRRIETSKMPLVKDGRIVGLVGFFRDIGPLEESAAHE